MQGIQNQVLVYNRDEEFLFIPINRIQITDQRSKGVSSVEMKRPFFALWDISLDLAEAGNLIFYQGKWK